MFRGDDEFLDPQPEGWGSVKRTAAAVSCGRFSLASAGGLYFSWSPLAVLGGVDAGGQNVHVAALAAALARRAHNVVVHTQRNDLHQPRRVQLAPGVVVDHVSAGPRSDMACSDTMAIRSRPSRRLIRLRAQQGSSR